MLILSRRYDAAPTEGRAPKQGADFVSRGVYGSRLYVGDGRVVIVDRALIKFLELNSPNKLR